MRWSRRKVIRRLGLPHDEALLEWAVLDDRPAMVPTLPLAPPGHLPQCVALTNRAVWLSQPGSVQQYPLDDIVLVSAPGPAEGALRMDFVAGDPLVVVVVDHGTFRRRLSEAIRSVEARLEIGAGATLGEPELSPDLLAAAERAHLRAFRLLAEYGNDPSLRMEAARHRQDARDLRHQARVEARRKRRTELLSLQRRTAEEHPRQHLA